MTTVEALDSVEAELTALGALDYLGQPLSGIMAAPIVSRYHGDAWRRLEDAFFLDHAIGAEAFMISAQAMIREVSQIRYSERVNRLLVQLSAS